MPNPRLAWEYVAYLAFQAKYVYLRPLWLTAFGATMTTCGFHALADYTPSWPTWGIVSANTLFSGGVSLLAWAAFGCGRQKDASLKWCLVWTMFAAAISLMLAAA